MALCVVCYSCERKEICEGAVSCSERCNGVRSSCFDSVTLCPTFTNSRSITDLLSLFDDQCKVMYRGCFCGKKEK